MHIYIYICIYIHIHICVSFYCQVSLIKDSYVCRDLFHKSLIFSRIFFFLATCKKRFPATFFHTVYMWFQKVGRSILKKCLIYKDFFSKATRKSRAMCFPPHFSTLYMFSFDRWAGLFWKSALFIKTFSQKREAHRSWLASQKWCASLFIVLMYIYIAFDRWAGLIWKSALIIKIPATWKNVAGSTSLLTCVLLLRKSALIIKTFSQKAGRFWEKVFIIHMYTYMYIYLDLQVKSDVLPSSSYSECTYTCAHISIYYWSQSHLSGVRFPRHTCYWVAAISMLLQTIGFFCKRAI